ncbi:Y4yA family PLP-dependent enzyme [Actinoplanes sp. TBRC 11911]|uniref:Y4yA family PLP-dependent enzyme n=1 Tax=Actinoplanes sp. TBRC 11911 TaxID=2729386 RepID=UPI00145F4F68|nr:Y4yA family PLP-dependent enzyme [Actinoplanes sp. TBRC 11911]NMO53972.1 Y4yA family PLP-dependent enzyme [Actinoplanes sp. TBRC 11911]
MLFLTPRIDDETQSFLECDGLARQLVESLGSPLNVVFPERAEANVRAFRDVYDEHRLGGRIYFAHKANRSSALLRALAATEAGVDVASLGELQHALGAGFGPDRIIATGPKDAKFRWLAERTGITVNADSIEELAALNNGTRVMVRLSDFPADGVRVMSRRSRFGVPVQALPDALDVVEKNGLHLVGLSYHLDTIGVAEKALAMEKCLAALDRCRERGHEPRSLDIGGGFGVNYLADGAQWERYTSELARGVLGKRPPLTWDGHGYGLRNEAGTVRGTLALYPAYRPVSGAGYLDRLLGTVPTAYGRELGSLLLDDMYDLDIEPGRALLDQCGLVLASVAEVRSGGDGDVSVRLAMNARDVSLEEHGVLMDPVLIGGEPDSEPTGVYLLGNLCLEADLITRRTVFLPRMPRPGDVLAFVNTAGYFMDFSSTRALFQPVARTVAAVPGGGGRWRWCLDDEYWPVPAHAEVA